MFISWGLLLAAIGVEVASTAGLSHTDGFRAPGWSALVLLGYGLSIWMLSLVIKHMSVSVAYAVWSGLGTACIAVVGAVLLGERLDVVKVLALACIIGGVVVLNLHGAH